MAVTKATKARKTRKASTKKPAEAPEDDELAGIDEELAALEDATDLDDLDVDEPDDEDDEHEEEAPAKRSKGKKAAAKTSEPDEDEEDDEADDEEGEDDGLDEMDRAELKAYIVKEEIDLGETVKKSWSDDDLREKIRDVLEEDEDDESDEDDEDDEPAEEPVKKGRGRPKGSGANPPRAAKTPADDAKLSADDVAAIGGIAEHQVRALARKHPTAFPKATPKSQYKFNPRQAHALLKRLGALAT